MVIHSIAARVNFTILGRSFEIHPIQISIYAHYVWAWRRFFDDLGLLLQPLLIRLFILAIDILSVREVG